MGIGDKHVPFIHNVMNTDAVAGIDSSHTDRLALLFDSAAGREYLTTRRGVPKDLVDQLGLLGYSAIANMLGAIKAAKHFHMTADDVIVMVATDPQSLYASEMQPLTKKYFGAEQMDAVHAGEVYGMALMGAD